LTHIFSFHFDAQAIEVLTRVFNVSGLPKHATAENFTVVGCDGGKQIGVQFNAAPTSLRWGPTHNCTICCANTTQVLEVCNSDNCDEPKATWDSVSVGAIALSMCLHAHFRVA
jgi:hypothetical protein